MRVSEDLRGLIRRAFTFDFRTKTRDRCRVEAILKTAHDAFISITEQGIILDWNLHAEKMFGFLAKDVLGKPVVSTLVPARFRSVFWKNLSERHVNGYLAAAMERPTEALARHRDGHEFLVELTIGSIRSGSSRIFYGILRDVSARKRAEKISTMQLAFTLVLGRGNDSQKTAQEFLEIICKNLGFNSGAIWKSTTDSTEWDLISLWQNSAFVTHPLHSLDTPSSWPTIPIMAPQVVESGDLQWTDDMSKIDHIAFAPQPMSSGLHGMVSFPVKSNGKIIGIVELYNERVLPIDPGIFPILEDAGHRLSLFFQRRQATENLDDAQRTLQAVTTSSPLATIMLDRQRRVLLWNPMATSVFGWSEEEVLGRPLVIVSQTEGLDHQTDLWGILNGSPQCQGAQVKGLRKDGKTIEVGLWTSTLCNEKGDADRIIGVFADMTERNQERKDLQIAKDQAIEASKVKSLFLANMSHEIRTPLAAMIGFADLLVERQDLATEALRAAAAIKRNGECLSKLVDDILDLTKVEARKLRIDATFCSLPKLLAELLELHTPQANNKGLRLVTSMASPLPDSILTDSLRLHQILNNIIGNAIKFTAAGEVSLHVSYKMIAGSKTKMVILFKVSDSGLGMSLGEQIGIFQPFCQADASTSRRFGGTGLGLALARNLAQSLGGDVTLTSSQPEVGSEFLISIPTELANDSSLTHLAYASGTLVRSDSASGFSASSLQGVSVLVVEDSPDIQVLIQQQLLSLGAAIDLADNGVEALVMTSKKTFDIILMDIQMPGLDGYQTVGRMRESGYRQPIIALTAHAMAEERTRCLEAGFDAHLSKPASKIQLLESIDRYRHIT